MYQFPTRPLGIGSLLDSSFKLFAAGLRPAFGLVVPYGLISGVSSSLMMGALMQTGPDGLPVVQFSEQFWIYFLVGLLCNVVLLPAIIKRIDAVARGETIGAAAALRFALARSGWVLLCLILYSLAISAGFLLLLVPGLILMLSLMLGPYLIVVLERRGPLDSLLDSHRLIWGNWWRTALIMTVAMIVLFVVYSLVVLAAGILAAFGALSSEGGSTLFEVITNVAASIVIVPFLSAVVLVIYYDLKLRREGGDLAARIGQVETA